MIRIIVRKDDYPGSEDYEAWLLGWATSEGSVMAMVARRKGETPWMVHRSRVWLWEDV